MNKYSNLCSRIFLSLWLSTPIIGQNIIVPEKKPPGPTSTGMPILDAIIGQKPDRYEVVRGILKKDPTQADRWTQNLGFTVYQSGGIENKPGAKMFPLTAAIDLNDFEMLRLLAESGAELCQQSYGRTESEYCAVVYAAEQKREAMHKYLKEMHRKEMTTKKVWGKTGYRVKYWSDDSLEIKEINCKNWSEGKADKFNKCIATVEMVFWIHNDYQ